MNRLHASKTERIWKGMSMGMEEKSLTVKCYYKHLILSNETEIIE